MPGMSGSLFRWIVVGLIPAALAVCLGVIVHGRHRLELLERETAALRAVSRQVDELRQENRRLRQLEVSHDELERYRRQAEEVHKLRGQYQEWQRLKQEHAALQQENARLRAAQPAASTAAAPPPPRGVWIGVGLRNATDPNSGGQAVAVANLAPGGPAANSGLAPGDVILSVNGRAVSTPAEVKEGIRTQAAGSRVLVDVMRNGTRLQFGVVTESFPAFE